MNGTSSATNPKREYLQTNTHNNNSSMHYQELELEGCELHSTYQMGELEAPLQLPNGKIGMNTYKIKSCDLVIY